MSLHNEIMNIQENPENRFNSYECPQAYSIGHRDARHAAAELSLRYQSLIERLLDALECRHADDYVDSIREEFNLYE